LLELARFAATAKVTAIERMGKERRAATLVALVSTLEATAQERARLGQQAEKNAPLPLG
jgi:hypothetical protein